MKRQEDLAPEDLKLQTLFAIYRLEVTPEKSPGKQGHDRSTAEMFIRFFGPNRKVKALTKWDVTRFKNARHTGQISPKGSIAGEGVRDRQVEYDLRFLMAVLNWATQRPVDNEKRLLESNPLRDLKKGDVPREVSPNRPIMFHERYVKMLSVAEDVDWRFELALIFAHETGHRIGAIRNLKWSDIDLDFGKVRWRRQNDKIGMEHVTELTEVVVAALQGERELNPGMGEAWVFPSPKDPSRSVDRYLPRRWWMAAEEKAGLGTMDLLHTPRART